MIKKIIVASKNPVKIQSVKTGFEKMFPDDTFDINGISVPSGVPDQPMSDKETLLGAKNRVKNAAIKYPQADFYVGLEGGLQAYDEDLEAFAWIYIQSGKKTGIAKTATFYLPPQVITLIHQGKELGEADDIVFGQINSKQKNGAVGILTGNVINRTSYYAEAVILALIPFKNAALYNEKVANQ